VGEEEARALATTLGELCLKILLDKIYKVRQIDKKIFYTNTQKDFTLLIRR
jgi:anti-anti-sigma regulatory factor